ncbi:MAG TPA: tRNA (adenosine(37)-N6)-dimethylallyltransferase MiaA [Chthoniobacterales bacterium]|nr:tRNA (adenosine(37)-N6)-dimethylallyltransferase MiaA [Chthoniobacterales bacterium]
MPSLQYLVLAGPTAVGKTELSIKIALGLRTEIISCDAYQIYSGLDLLTAKPSHSNLTTVRHHLIGSLPLTEDCDAHKYASFARSIISDLNRRGIIPLVVAGTGFYLEGLEGVLPELPPVDVELRRELNCQPTPGLLRELKLRDPITSVRIDRHNRRRIIRALEVCMLTGKPFSESIERGPTDPPVAAVTLVRLRAELVERIDRRVDEMFEQGVIEEVAAVETIGSTASKAIGFLLIRDLLAGKIDGTACREGIKSQTRSYAKRQMTWFRRKPFSMIEAESSTSRIIELLRTASVRKPAS